MANLMRLPALSILAALAIAACTKEADVTQPAAASAAAPAATPAAPKSVPPGFGPLPADLEVSLATPLVPGIPGSPGHLIVSERNPNGDSELSHLMRLFVDDLQAARATIEAGGKPPELYHKHRRIRAAWPSKADERNEAFDMRAQGYLAAVRAFDAAHTADTFNAIIASCIACHSVSCGGPIDFIDGMKWQ